MRNILLVLNDKIGYVIIKREGNDKLIEQVIKALSTPVVSEYTETIRDYEVQIDYKFSALASTKEQEETYNKLYSIYNSQPCKHGD